MIAGFFTPDGEPHVDGILTLRRLGIGGRVRFPVDTGADATILHPDAATDPGCPFDSPINPAEFLGLRGTLDYCMEPAPLSPEDTQLGWQEFSAHVSIAKPHPPADGLDSLPGRDISNQLDVQYGFPRRQLTFT